MRKLVSLLLALVMVFSLATVAFAAGENGSTPRGTITVKDVAVYKPDDESAYETVAKYAVYKILDIVTYDEDKNLYTYEVRNDSWKTFLTTDEVAKNYFVVASNGYVTWNKTSQEEPTAVAAIIAPRALEWANAHSDDISIASKTYTMGSVKTSTTGDTTADITFSDLSLGYYLVDSSMGVLCGLTTASPDAEVLAKNVPPTLSKQVKEDAFAGSVDESEWGDVNTADIGQLVEYDITIDVRSGAQNYVLHDVLGDGLTIVDQGSVTHRYGNQQSKPLTAGTDYVLHAAGTEGCICGQDDCAVISDNCTFEMVFTQSFLSTVKTNDKIIVRYNAILNDNAVTGAAGNPNTAWVSFGEGHETEEEVVKTYTYFFDLVKTDGDRNLLDGAEFQMYYSETGGSPIAVKHINKDKENEEGYYPIYQLIYDKNGTIVTGTANNSTIVVAGGRVRIVGIDKGTYYLEETQEPTGYNRLTARHSFSITDKDLEVTFDGTKVSATTTAVRVQNNAGAMLPQTGAAGTMMFITFGMLTVLATGVLLVTKKRMSMIEE